MTKDSEARQWKKSKGKKQRKLNGRGTRATTPRAPPPHPSLRCHRPFLLFLVAVLHWRRRSSHVGGPQKVEHRWAAPLIRQEVAHSPLPLPPLRLLLDPRPQLSLLIFPPRAVLEQVVSRLLRSTVVVRVAPPTVVV